MTARTLIAILAAAALLGVPALAPAQERASLPDIEDEVMCPVCGTVLEHAFAPQAERERELIRTLIAEGKTKDQIKDALVAEYGEDVLAVPDDEGFDLAAWVVPAGGFLAALVAIILALLAVRRRGRDGDAAPEPPLPPDDAARLDAELKRYDA
jgi:cytochrome c-type biogenesis protein CcmH